MNNLFIIVLSFFCILLSGLAVYSYWDILLAAAGGAAAGGAAKEEGGASGGVAGGFSRCTCAEAGNEGS